MKSTERLQHLIYLLQSGKKLRVSDLADQFNVTKRTIYRDLNRLSELNIPVTHDSEKGYGIMSTSEISPIMFTEKELATIIMGLAFVRSQINTQLREDAEKVSRKINASLPQELRRIMVALEGKTIVDPFLRKKGVETSGGNWFVISRGLTLNRPIEFTYRAKKGDYQHRTADPLLLVYYYDHWNMVGYCHDRDDLRNFILERMSSVVNSSKAPKGNITDDREPENLLFRLDDPFYVTVKVYDDIYNEFIKHLPSKIEKEEKSEKKSRKINFQFDNYEFINRWLLQFADSLEVISPKELVDLRNKTLRKMLNVSRET